MPIDTLRLENDRRLVSVVMAMMVIPIVWFASVDWILLADDPQRLRGRLLTRAISVAIPIVGLLFLRGARTHKAYARTVLAVSLAMAADLLILKIERPYGTVLFMRSPLMFLIVMYGAMPNTFYRQITAPLLFSAGTILQRIFWLNANTAGDMASDILIVVFVNMAGVLMVYRRRVLEREVAGLLGREQLAKAEAERALKELKTLRGIIRICSYCRKIHNEAGVWQQIEAYVREHSHAEFSHGICPDCMIEHFPQPAQAD